MNECRQPKEIYLSRGSATKEKVSQYNIMNIIFEGDLIWSESIGFCWAIEIGQLKVTVKVL